MTGRWCKIIYDISCWGWWILLAVIVILAIFLTFTIVCLLVGPAKIQNSWILSNLRKLPSSKNPRIGRNLEGLQDQENLTLSQPNGFPTFTSKPSVNETPTTSAGRETLPLFKSSWRDYIMEQKTKLNTHFGQFLSNLLPRHYTWLRYEYIIQKSNESNQPRTEVAV